MKTIKESILSTTGVGIKEITKEIYQITNQLFGSLLENPIDDYIIKDKKIIDLHDILLSVDFDIIVATSDMGRTKTVYNQNFFRLIDLCEEYNFKIKFGCLDILSFYRLKEIIRSKIDTFLNVVEYDEFISTLCLSGYKTNDRGIIEELIKKSKNKDLIIRHEVHKIIINPNSDFVNEVIEEDRNKFFEKLKDILLLKSQNTTLEFETDFREYNSFLTAAEFTNWLGDIDKSFKMNCKKLTIVKQKNVYNDTKKIKEQSDFFRKNHPGVILSIR